MSKVGGGVVRRKPRIGLVFCEDENDAESLKNLAAAIWPGIPRVDYCRKPLILMRDRKAAEARKKNAADVLAVLKAKEVTSSVGFVIAHQDCDSIEPAHVALAAKIREELERQQIQNVVAVAPAWETEAWWYLWPAAVAAANSKWRPLSRTGNHGMITNAKEQLRRDLRSSRARDYEESDSRKISSNVRVMNILDCQTGTCSSFNDFKVAILEVKRSLDLLPE